MHEEAFSPEQSLELIRTMIDKTKNSVADNSFYFLLWGWLVFAACIMQFVLKVIVQTPYHPVAWYLMFVGIVFSILHAVRRRNDRSVRTYVEEMLNYLWISIFFSYVLFGFIFARMGWQNCYAFYMLMYALGCFVTGRLLKFPPLVWGAIGSWALAVVSTFTDFDVNILLCAAAIMISYIIPGYLLRNKYKNQS
ncbi:MAG TPA: hypothetical protein VMI35_04895 [Puia sp.]|nr:hypothetical protein [Puia sp.]